jgi:hypothetical protein
LIIDLSFTSFGDHDPALEMVARESRWSEAVAVGSLSFVNTVKSELGFKAAHREVTEQGETYVLREESEAYRSNFAGENEVLSSENARLARK